MQQMVGCLHDNTVRDVRHLVDDGIITLRDWVLRGASTLLAWTPRGILDKVVRETHKHPEFPISGRTSVQSGNEESGKLARQMIGTPSTQRQPRGTRDSELEEILRKACESWEEALLVDFLTQEYGKTYGARNPNVTLSAFLENPCQYIEENAERGEVVKKLPEKLHHLKDYIFRDVTFLQAVGIMALGQWANHRFYRELLTPVTNCILSRAYVPSLDEGTDKKDALTVHQ
ncbi:hypothetical protein TRVL_09872 [Trypanosoma vivax]|nr:hypothetical protein TRVL_09872 [Trypanosoma vivax]